MPSPDPKSLQLFLSVVRHGTIAAAAEAEHIAAAAVSRRLGELEEQLGTPLVVRSNKGIEPTPAGRALVTLSHRVLNDLDDIRHQMRDYAAGVKGYVRVFANLSAITQFMPAELGAFLDANPLVRIHLEERLSADIAAAVAENSADIGILVLDGQPEGVEILPYRKDDLSLVVPAGHPLADRRRASFADTLAFDYIGLKRGSQLYNQQARAAREAGLPWRCRFEVPSYDALCLMVQARLGLGILPRRLAQDYARALDIRALDLDEDWARRELHLCLRSYDALSASARRLVDHMLAGQRGGPFSGNRP